MTAAIELVGAILFGVVVLPPLLDRLAERVTPSITSEEPLADRLRSVEVSNNRLLFLFFLYVIGHFLNNIL